MINVQRSHQQLLQELVPADHERKYPRPDDLTRVVILFTARSGSTWLCDLLDNTKQFGYPGEFWNQVHIPEIAKKFSVRSEIDYANALEADAVDLTKVFSMKVTAGDIQLFETLDFFGHYSDARYIILRRRSIVDQAISLALAIRTELFHATSPEQRQETVVDMALIDDVRHWCGHILWHEQLLEAQILMRKIEPLRLYYEDFRPRPQETVERIFNFCGLPGAPEVHSKFHRVSADINREVKAAFMHRYMEFSRRLSRIRPLCEAQ